MQGSRINALRSGFAATVIVAGALGIGACGSSSKTTTTTGSGGSTASSGTSSSASSGALPGKGKPAFVLGDKNFAEEYILGDLYQQALEAQGYTVTLKPNIGDTEVTFASLKSGAIDGYPEYDGTLLASVANDSKIYSSAAATEAATDAYATKNGYVFTTATPFTDADDIAVLKTYATANHLTSIADLKPLGKKVILAGAAEFQSRYPDGLLGLQKLYGVEPTFTPTSIGDFYTLLNDKKADAVAGFTTDPQLKSGKYTVLTDPKGIFGYQNVGMIAKASVVAKEGPAFTATINKVSALLTQTAMIDLDTDVEIDQQNPATVAKAFLKDNGLL